MKTLLDLSKEYFAGTMSDDQLFEELKTVVIFKPYHDGESNVHMNGDGNSMAEVVSEHEAVSHDKLQSFGEVVKKSQMK